MQNKPGRQSHLVSESHSPYSGHLSPGAVLDLPSTLVLDPEGPECFSGGRGDDKVWKEDKLNWRAGSVEQGRSPPNLTS